MRPDLMLIIRQALDLPAEARAEFLRAAFPDDPDLQQQLLVQVAASEQEVSKLGHEQTETAHADASLLGLKPGLQIGAFRLLRELGAGGMGVVWQAERCDGFAQTVAIKWLQAAAQPSLIQRFQRERVLLARLQHPNIARILDGGEWQGLPWYAMEFVDGQTLDRYVRARSPDLAARLELILQIAAAIQYAHQNLIVHRDLKPANVLVNQDGQVKLLDFGIAKLLDDTDQLTETRAPMTLAYAAPEQIAGEVVTVATDVYALGGLLYELLTGQRPYRANSSVNLMHQIANTDPEPPSRVPVSADAATLPNPLHVPADLDTITLKALARRPDRRYPSVAAFAEDLRRFRDGFPISARPDSTWYRLRLWLNRHRLAAALALLASVSLIGGTVIASVQAARARTEAARAQRAADTALAVSSAMKTLLAAAGPDQNGGVELSVREALNLGSADALQQVAKQPEVAAALRRTLARVYLDLGDAKKALALAQAADLKAASDDDRYGLQVIELEAFTTLGDYASARALVDRVDAAFNALPATHPARVDYLPSRALFEQEGGDRVAVRATVDAWIKEVRAGVPPDASVLSMALEVAADLDMAAGKPQAAVAQLTEAQTLLRQVEHPELRRARIDGMLGSALRAAGDAAGAASLLAESVTWHTRVLGAKHPQSLTVRGEQAIHFSEVANLPEARRLQQEIQQDRIEVYGENHPKVAIGFNQLAITEYNMAEYAAAAEHFRRAVDILTPKLPPNHDYLLLMRSNLAGSLCELGRGEEAMPILDQTIAIYQALQSPRLASLLITRGRAFEQQERLLEARRDYQAAIALQADNPNKNDDAWARTLWGHTERRLGHTEVAIAELSNAIKSFDAMSAGCGPRCALANLEYSRALAEAKRPLAEIRPPAERALAIRAERFGPSHALTEEVRTWLLESAERAAQQ